ncbi:MAG: DUF4234 domain-containing protein [Clostridia bacterium]|nr:DUF4234 domain-containing protein [Clostridia bacterium]
MLPDGANFCTVCGANLAQQQYQQQQYQQQYQQPYGQAQYQQPYGQQQYQQPYGQPQVQEIYIQQPYSAPPARQLNTSRGILKFILLTIITFGIYAIVAFSSISESINIAASRYDGKKTMHFCLLMFLIGPITLGIAVFVWFHKISNRIGNECARRGVGYSVSAADFWIFYFLLSFTLVCPFIYLHKLFKATNLICADYNMRG